MTSLKAAYAQRFKGILQPAAVALEGMLKDLLDGVPRIERIGVRPKSLERFLAKAKNRNADRSLKYTDPLNQIQDQIGARVIVLYLNDVDPVRAHVEKYFTHIERKQLQPEAANAFGYVGYHYIALLPRDVLPAGVEDEEAPDFFEVQVKTLWQHAWSEANHDLGYKASQPLNADQQRSLAFAAAQAWGADKMFAQLYEELKPKPPGKLVSKAKLRLEN